MGDFYVGDFEFEAAEFGVVVFAQLVGEMDDTVLLQVHRLCSFCPVPAYGWECDGAWALRELQADMPVLNKTGRRGDAHVLREEDWFFVSHAAGVQAAKPGEKSGSDAVERYGGVNCERAAQRVLTQVEESIGFKALTEFGDARRGK